MDSMAVSFVPLPCFSPPSILLHSILKSMILGASNLGLPCFALPLVG